MEDRRGWQTSLVILTLLMSISVVALLVAWWQGLAGMAQLFPTSTPITTSTPTLTATPTRVPLPTTPIATPMPFIPTPTSTPVVKPEIGLTATAEAAQRATA
ncbi:MAG: hypothetical protein HYR94_21135, partial [Chloroflexi bacterium]|nr:hypothetical protein [Chloroflexota bacterium]